MKYKVNHKLFPEDCRSCKYKARLQFCVDGVCVKGSPLTAQQITKIVEKTPYIHYDSPTTGLLRSSTKTFNVVELVNSLFKPAREVCEDFEYRDVVVAAIVKHNDKMIKTPETAKWEEDYVI